MKKNKAIIDQEIQEALDGRISPHGERDFSMYEDAELYKSLFQSLDDKPEVHFDDDFTKTIVELAHKRKRIREVLWKVALYTLVSIPLTAVSILVVIAMDPDVFWQVVESLKYNINYLLFGGIVFAAIQILDMLLIKKKLPDAGT
jgi:ABC-type bacteriocin/lantibiotic exporter with double-glycine peptidase domain